MLPKFAAAFGVIQGALFLMHAAVYAILAMSFGLNSPSLAWLFALLSISFVSSSALAHRYCNQYAVWYYRVGAYWFGLLIFLYVAAIGLFFSEYVLFAMNCYFPPALLGGIYFGFIFLLHSYATWQTQRLK